MAKEHFTIDGSREVLGYIDEAGRKAGFSRGQAFEDFLTLVRCSLAGQTMEDEYLATVRKGYDKGTKGSRGIDIIVKAFATTVNLMEETGQDVLGDIFQGGVTYGENGQFFTPPSLTTLMGQLVTGDDDGKERKTVCDPACGSGRCLLTIAEKHPHWEFTGQDADHRCTQMAAINFGLRNIFGYAVWQNTLTLKVHRVYKTGLNLGGGVIREIPVEHSPFNYQEQKPKKETPDARAPIIHQLGLF